MIVSTIKREKIPTYPARPYNGGYLTEENEDCTKVYTTKVDGSRILGNVYSLDVFNRYGERYSKSKDVIPHLKTSLRDIYEELMSPIDDITERTGWVDCEHLCKHDTFKGKVALLDLPMRKYSHLDFKIFLTKEFGSPEANINMDFSVYEGVVILPWMMTGHPSTLMAKWKYLRELAKRGMHMHNESTPFIEGFVGVEASSNYPVQIISPTHKSGGWVKHRFSN